MSETKPVKAGVELGVAVDVTVYLPTGKDMKINISDVSTVGETIQEILRTHQAELRQPPLYYDHPECYELRLHDSDGLPDEGFPPLDRSRELKNFGGANSDDHEYCLCERPGECPPTCQPVTETAQGVAATTDPQALAFVFSSSEQYLREG